jgi:hypothetical protein
MAEGHESWMLKVQASGTAQCGNYDQIRPEMPTRSVIPAGGAPGPLAHRAFGTRTGRVPASPRGPVLVLGYAMLEMVD